MKIKNLLMQLFIMTPLATIMSALAWLLIGGFISKTVWEMDLLALAFMIILCIGINFIIAKILLKIKGKETEETYWDSNFEYEFRHDYGDHYSWHQTRGGWTTTTLFIVWIYVALSPILVVTQLISLIFAFVALFSKRIASWYGAINYETLSFSFLQSLLHFFFHIVILQKNHHLE